MFVFVFQLPVVIRVPRLQYSALTLCEIPMSLLGFGDIIVPGEWEISLCICCLVHPLHITLCFICCYALLCRLLLHCFSNQWWCEENCLDRQTYGSCVTCHLTCNFFKSSLGIHAPLLYCTARTTTPLLYAATQLSHALGLNRQYRSTVMSPFFCSVHYFYVQCSNFSLF